jgi:hypothetical protein
MPIGIDKVNLIIPKKTIETNYLGGKEQFEKDYDFSEEKTNSQDSDLYNIAMMNLEQSVIMDLIEKGLHFDYEAKTSLDFTIYDRYYGFYWEIDEVKEIDGVFLIHKNANEAEYKRAIEISEMGVDFLYAENTDNYKLLQTFRIDDKSNKNWFQKLKGMFSFKS